MDTQNTLVSRKHGTVIHNGIALTITQPPYLTSHPDDLSPCYRSSATAPDGAEYRVIWAITAPDAKDESEACNWEQPESIVAA